MFVNSRKKITLVAVLLLFLSFGKETGWASGPQMLEMKVEADRLLKQGQLERSIPLYEKVVQEDREFANAYYNLATAYYLQGESGKAARNLEAFLKLRPEDAEALYNLGCLKLRMGAWEEAREYFLRAEDCPCTRLISKKIKEALHFVKDLQNQGPENRELIAYLLSV